MGMSFLYHIFYLMLSFGCKHERKNCVVAAWVLVLRLNGFTSLNLGIGYMTISFSLRKSWGGLYLHWNYYTFAKVTFLLNVLFSSTSLQFAIIEIKWSKEEEKDTVCSNQQEPQWFCAKGSLIFFFPLVSLFSIIM